MSEILTFGEVVAIAAIGLVVALASSGLSERTRIPAPWLILAVVFQVGLVAFAIWRDPIPPYDPPRGQPHRRS